MKIQSLDEYSLLGRSGLRVSPLCLGTMTFGTEWGWGSPAKTAQLILNQYLEAGGNFVDTADGYTNGKSEELLGKFIKENGNRDRIVLATKFTFNGSPGDPNAGGNGRKNMIRAVESSLKRLQTDYIDLYWLHAWDALTPVEEVMYGLDTLVRCGKVRYIGLSDTPAWYLSRAQTIAELRGWERICALQLEYSLIERNIEREHVPAAMELGMGICPWSPLASGFLTGKYKRGKDGAQGEGRLKVTKNSGNPTLEKFKEENNWKALDVLMQVSKELGHSPAQIAINFITRRPGVSSTIIGATKPTQLDDNLKSLEFEIPQELHDKLEESGRPKNFTPYLFFQETIQSMIRGGITIHKQPRTRRRL